MAQDGSDLPNGVAFGHAPHDSALSIGSSREEDVARIKDLEEEVKYLADRANQASQKFADYENEIATLQAKLRQEQKKHVTPGGGESPQQTAPEKPQLSRFGSLMRKPSAGPPNGTVPTPAVREKELEEKVVREQTARIAAETKVKEVNAEIEDLSTTLFQQANEMVAAERKENAALAEKIRMLEQRQEKNEEAVKEQAVDATAAVKLEAENVKLKAKIEALERREGERRKRLERLEKANERIERVKGMLKPG